MANEKKGVVDITTGVEVNDLNSAAIEVSLLGTPTYTDVQDFINTSQGASAWTGFTISDGGSGTIDIAAGTGLIKTTNSAVGANVSFDYAGTTGLALTDLNTNFIYIDYNAGAPIAAANVSIAAINLRTQIMIGRVYRNGSTVHILTAGQFFAEYQTADCLQSFEVYGFQRASGEIMGETGTRNLTVTAGVDYCAHNRFTTSAIDTSAADTYDVWNSAASTTPDATGVTQVDNANYWNGSIVTALTSNRYGTRFFYRDHAGHIHMQYGTSNTVSEANALAETVPIPPAFLTGFAIYIGRIVIQEGAAVFAEITNPFEVVEEGTIVTDHGNLAGLSDDDHAQYAFLAGRSGGQDLIGGTGSGEDITFESTSDSTKGSIISKDNFVIGTGAAGIDYSLTFNGESNQGALTWWEDENRLEIQTDETDTRTNFYIVGNGTGNARIQLEQDGSNSYFRLETLATSMQNRIGSSIAQMIFNTDNQDCNIVLRGAADDELLVTDAGTDTVCVGGTTTTAKFNVDGTTLLDGNVVIGAGAAGVDYTLTFDGETSDGAITWMEDEKELTIATTLANTETGVRVLGNGSGNARFTLQYGNTVTDSTYFLQTSGPSGIGFGSTTTAFQINASQSFIPIYISGSVAETYLLCANASTNTVGIGTGTPAVALDIGSKTDAVFLPSGTTAERPGSPANGMIRYNSQTNKFEGYENGGWANLI